MCQCTPSKRTPFCGAFMGASADGYVYCTPDGREPSIGTSPAHAWPSAPMTPLECRCRHLEMTLSIIANYNSPDPEEDGLTWCIETARNALEFVNQK